jgi:hypothetical protein
MPANEFAVPRMEPGRQRPIQSMEEARDWERPFIGEVKAGRDPRRPRIQRKSGDSAPPFHRFGVRMNKKLETTRDRRLSREEEKRLLDTALQKMNAPEHQFVGPLLHDRVIGALELCCRRGEMLLIQNRRMNWETCQVGIPGATAKDKENRRIPFNPEGRLAAILKRRSTLGPDAYVFGSESGAYQPNIQTAWETLGLSPTASSRGRAGKAPRGIANRSSGSISAGMTYGTKAPAASWPTAWTSGSSNRCSATPASSKPNAI